MIWDRDDNGTWFTEHNGFAIEGRTQYVEAVLRYLQGLRVSEFVPDEQVRAIAPFSTPPRSITVNLANGGEQMVTVGRRLESRIYAGPWSFSRWGRTQLHTDQSGQHYPLSG